MKPPAPVSALQLTHGPWAPSTIESLVDNAPHPNKSRWCATSHALGPQVIAPRARMRRGHG